jgi:hypothetical protein
MRPAKQLIMCRTVFTSLTLASLIACGPPPESEAEQHQAISTPYSPLWIPPFTPAGPIETYDEGPYYASYPAPYTCTGSLCLWEGLINGAVYLIGTTPAGDEPIGLSAQDDLGATEQNWWCQAGNGCQADDMYWRPGRIYTLSGMACTANPPLCIEHAISIGTPRFKWARPALGGDPGATYATTSTVYNPGGQVTSNGVTRRLPICRGNNPDGSIVAGYLDSDGLCYTVWGGNAGGGPYYEALEAASFNWGPAQFGDSAFVAAQDASGNGNFVCLATVTTGSETGTYPGTVTTDGSRCYFSRLGVQQAVSYPHYKLLQIY